MQISRSEQKRRIKEIERLVGELVTLSSHALEQTPFSAEIKQTLLETANLRGSVRQRQIKYLTKLVQEYPLEGVYGLISQYRGRELREQQQFQAMEFYRNTLINEAIEQQQACRESGDDWKEDWSSATVMELQRELPEVDPLTLSRLSYLFARTRNPRYSREIFRYLRSMQELGQRKKQREDIASGS